MHIQLLLFAGLLSYGSVNGMKIEDIQDVFDKEASILPLLTDPRSRPFAMSEVIPNLLPSILYSPECTLLHIAAYR